MRSLITFSLIFLMCAIFSHSCRKNEEKKEPPQLSPAELKEILGVGPDIQDSVFYSDQELIEVNLSNMEFTMILNGYIDADQRRTRKISSRAAGRIEKLLVKYPGVHVSKGQKILDLYSPELESASEEYIYLKEQGETILIDKAKEKLKLLGMTEGQISKLGHKHGNKSRIAVFSPFEGYILEGVNENVREMDMSTAGSMETGMEGMSMGSGNNGKMETQPGSRSGEWLREGQYFGRDETIFEVNDLEVVSGIILADVKESKWLKNGTSLKVFPEENPADFIPAKIDLIEPVFENGEKLMRLRVYLPNKDHQLLLNSLFKAEVEIRNDNVLAVPESAVLELGGRKIVWLFDESISALRSREVTVSKVSGNQMIILSGLSQGDKIALNAGMILDSETILRK